jgi:hypothetical protein
MQAVCVAKLIGPTGALTDIKISPTNAVFVVTDVQTVGDPM